MKSTGKSVLAVVIVAVAGLTWLSIRYTTTPRANPARLSEDPDSAGIVTADRLDGSAQSTGPSRESRSPSEGASPPESPASQSSGSRLVFMSMSDGALAVGSRWRLRNASIHGQTAESVADSRGSVGIAPGTWQLESMDVTWTPTVSTIDVQPGSCAVVWLQASGERQFRVLSREGRPLAGVRGYWAPRFDPGQTDTARRAFESRSDSSGLLSFNQCPVDSGTAVFFAEGYQRETRSLSGPAHGVVDVVLYEQSGESRLIRFRSCVDGSPVFGVSVESLLGFSIARAGGESDTVVLPPDTSADELLLAVSSTTMPSWFRARDAGSTGIALAPGAPIRVVVRDDSTCAGPIRIEFEGVGATSASDLAQPTLPASREIKLEDVSEVVLPLGVELTVTAQDSCNRVAVHSLDRLERPPLIELTLARSPHLQVWVRDDAGSSVSFAQAIVQREFEQRLFRADAGGGIRVPLQPSPTSIRVSADGHAPVIVDVDSLPPESNVDPSVTIALTRALDVPLRFESPTGVPLRGVLVRVLSRVSEVRSRAEAEHGIGIHRANVIGTTDGDGVFLARGLLRGNAGVSVSLNGVFGTDDWNRTLYEIPERVVSIDDASEKTIVCPQPRNVALQVFDASTRLPVRGFRIADAEQSLTIDVPGDTWHGWISEDMEDLVVTVDDVGVARVDLRGHDGSKVLRVNVSRGKQFSFRVENLPSSSAAVQLGLIVMRDVDGGLHLTDRIDVTVDATGRGTVALGYPGDLFLGFADATIEGHPCRFVPELQAVASASELVFRCVQ